MNRGSNLPPSARVVTQYPDGVSTGVGGGNAAQAQSLNPKAPAYIPPTPNLTPDNGRDKDYFYPLNLECTYPPFVCEAILS